MSSSRLLLAGAVAVAVGAAPVWALTADETTTQNLAIAAIVLSSVFLLVAIVGAFYYCYGYHKKHKHYKRTDAGDAEAAEPLEASSSVSQRAQFNAQDVLKSVV